MYQYIYCVNHIQPLLPSQVYASQLINTYSPPTPWLMRIVPKANQRQKLYFSPEYTHTTTLPSKPIFLINQPTIFNIFNTSLLINNQFPVSINQWVYKCVIIRGLFYRNNMKRKAQVQTTELFLCQQKFLNYIANNL